MLSRNKQSRPVYRYVSAVLGIPLIQTVPFRGEYLNFNEFSFVACCLLENVRTNDFARLSTILRLMGKGRRSARVETLIPRLLSIGAIERPGFGLFVVTSEGEYWIRDVETMLVRITGNMDRSKWRKIQDGDTLRGKYVRGKRVKGSKVVSVPIDDRLKLKHGLPTLRKNGQPRNINLPGSNPIPVLSSY